jgi:hypothetical protein
LVTVNKKQASVLALVATFASIIVVGLVASNSAFAHSDDFWKRFFDNDDDNGGNSADQSIDQEQSSEQDSLCVSGDDTDDSCNNFSFQGQINTGNNAAGQQDSDEEED